MEERPRDPGVEREEVVERREVVERDTRAGPPPERDRVVVHERRGPGPAIWIIPLLIVVGLLLWYVLTRGERTQIQVPEIEAPRIEAPSPEPQRIEINLPERTEPAQPAPQPAQPAPGN
jgi:hypothetical protein